MNIQVQFALISPIGNKARNENFVFEPFPIPVTPEFELFFANSLLNLVNYTDAYEFYHPGGAEFNYVYSETQKAFNAEKEPIAYFQDLLFFLFEKSVLPNIKTGFVLFVQFFDTEADTNNLALFKFESKGYSVVVDEEVTEAKFFLRSVLDLSSVNKAAVFSLANDKNVSVYLLKPSRFAYDAKFWSDDFLAIKQMANEQTLGKDIMKASKQFIAEKVNNGEIDIEKSLEISEKMVAVAALKEDTSVGSFIGNVFADDDELYSEFSERISNNTQEKYGTSLNMEDSISLPFEKRGASSKIVLDSKFTIYCPISAAQEIEYGLDEGTNRKYIKIIYSSLKSV